MMYIILLSMLLPVLIQAQVKKSYSEKKSLIIKQISLAVKLSLPGWAIGLFLVIDKETAPEKRDAKVMAEIVRTFDNVFKAYDDITGVKPHKAGQFGDLAVIEVSDKVGGGLAHHNRLGIAVGTGFFENLYKRWQKGEKTLDQIYFYEIARNYWPPEFNRKIDYHTTIGVNDYGWWTVGFNNAMSIFLPSEVPTITDMHYFGSNGKQFAAGMEKNMHKYMEGNYTWKQGWCINLMPWAERTSLNDLMTALLNSAPQR